MLVGFLYKKRKTKNSFSDFIWNVVLFLLFVCLIMAFIPTAK
jgi:F0F1-type ATP synthase membrane subunit b/b'